MKYAYAYKTSDGTRHEAVIEAASREAAFSLLRARGIKPIKVVAADGSKANGEVRGVRKRVFAATLALTILLAGAVAYWVGAQKATSVIPLVQDRHQVYGDPAIIQEIESGAIPLARTDVEKFLLAYAIPGKAVRKLSPPASVRSQDLALANLSPSEGPEITAYRQILNGLKAEARAYLAGGGSWPSFVAELNLRQNREIEIYERIRRELKSITDPAIRDERNAALRALGLRTIPRPRK